MLAADQKCHDKFVVENSRLYLVLHVVLRSDLEPAERLNFQTSR